jgi:coenzyme F420-dependent glucose-6-phosphate dehydrogenase
LAQARGLISVSAGKRKIAMLAYHASHEQFAPSHLLRLAIMAEKAGFDAIHSSDHFNPWSKRQGHSGFAFSWVASALQATSLPVSMVCAPGQRYHPAVVAQAIATIGEMYPGRYAIELATGEAINEVITGESWPSKEKRNQRLLESVTVIRRLLLGEEVDFNGTIQVKGAKVWSLPSVLPPLFCAAISTETCGWCGAWADGLITTSGSPDDMKEKMTAFSSNGGEGRPVNAQYSFSYAATRQQALDAAHDQWRSNLLPREKLSDLYKTEDFDARTQDMSPEEVAEKVPLITSMEELFGEIEKISATGVNLISLHNVGRNHEEFIDAFERYKKSTKAV